MVRRKLTDEEIEKIAEKEWKKTPIFSSDEKFAYKAKNLTGPKTVEGKKRALKNLQAGRNTQSIDDVKHGGYVRKILNEDEQELYFSRREDYLRDYDINSSADEITLHQILMDEVIYYRLMARQANNPSIDISRPLNECTKRLNKALENLGALRKQRLNQDDKVATINIATLAQQFSREMNKVAMQKDQEKLEELEYLKNKKKRDLAVSYDNEIVIEEDNQEESE
jgi:hypothetical protein